MENENEKEDPVDFVLVWDGDNADSTTKESEKKRQIFEDNLRKDGLVLAYEVDQPRNLTFVKISATSELLRRYCEILRFRMPLKEVYLDRHDKEKSLFSRSMTQFKFWCCNTMNCLRLPSSIFPPEIRRFTAVYSRDKEYLFDLDEIESQFFTASLRARIIYFILRRTRYDLEPADSMRDDFKIGMDRLLKSRAYLAAYPLHDGDLDTVGSERNKLFKYWASFTKILKYQPLFAIKEYFGAEIGLYFAWLGFYTRMLIPASILGILCFAYGLATIEIDDYSNDVCDKRRNITMCPLCDTYCDYWSLHSACFQSKFTHMFDNDTTVLFATFMSFWTAIFLEYWKRYVFQLTHRWDLTKFDAQDQYPRPQYLARLNHIRKKKVHPVSHIPEPVVSFFRHKLPYTLISISTVFLMIFLAAAAVFAVIIYRLAVKLAFSKAANDDFELQQLGSIVVPVTAGLINLLFTLFFNWLYEGVAIKLTEWELHRTQLEFDDSYTLKIYLLKFINTYASIFYIAVFKGLYVGSPNKFVKYFGEWRQEECKIGCMPELCIQLAVVMVGKQAINFIFELLSPVVRNWSKNSKFAVDEDKRESEKQWVKDLSLDKWQKRTLIDEYLEMVLQYGFVTIFVTAFPLAPFFALINNIFEVRVDARKLLRYYRRPVALRVKDIGIWYPIMEFVGKLAVLSNAFIIAITSKLIPKLVYRFCLFDISDPRFGTLNGFLEHSLAYFNTSELETPPTPSVVTNPVDICRYPAYRYGYNEDPKLRYQPTEFYWRVWLARVVFILLFQNIVATIVLLIQWLIPDTPQKLREEIQREEHLTDELIIKNELMRAKEERERKHDCNDGSTLTLNSLADENGSVKQPTLRPIVMYSEQNENPVKNNLKSLQAVHGEKSGAAAGDDGEEIAEGDTEEIEAERDADDENEEGIVVEDAMENPETKEEDGETNDEEKGIEEDETVDEKVTEDTEAEVPQEEAEVQNEEAEDEAEGEPKEAEEESDDIMEEDTAKDMDENVGVEAAEETVEEAAKEEEEQQIDSNENVEEKEAEEDPVKEGGGDAPKEDATMTLKEDSQETPKTEEEDNNKTEDSENTNKT